MTLDFTITRKGLRAALDRVCLMCLPLVCMSVLFLVFSMGAWNTFQMVDPVAVIVAMSIISGTLAAAYLTIASVLWFVTPFEEPPEVRDAADEWARALTPKERQKQLDHYFIKSLAKLAGLALLALFSIGIVFENTALLFPWFIGFLFICHLYIQTSKRYDALERAHMRLRKADKERQTA